MDTTVEIQAREVDDFIVLDIRAENFTYPQTSILKNSVAHLLEKDQRLFVLNFTEVQIVDSYGLATVISTLKLIRENGGKMAMYGLNDMFVRLVSVTHLDRVLEVWPSESQAMYYLSTLQKAR